jgi:hypothetical protein
VSVMRISGTGLACCCRLSCRVATVWPHSVQE